MRVRLAQIDTTVADIAGNLAAITDACQSAREEGVEVLVTPELALLGYPPLDLLEREDLLAACERAVASVAPASLGLTVVVGTALPTPGDANSSPLGRPAINAAVVLSDGVHVATIAKRLLPSYDVFDEDRYFLPGSVPGVVTVAGRQVGITICEDIWSEYEHGPRRYDLDPVAELVQAGADCILNLSASPFDLGKAARRYELVAGAARRHGVPTAYCNLVGGNDQLIFDGRSFAVDGHGALLAAGPAFVTALIDCDLPAACDPTSAVGPTPPPPAEFAPRPALEARAALVLGVRDYVHKCGFRDVIIGLSGGIDSALTAAIAVEALGPDKVLGVAMPGPYSSEGSVVDALALAKNLGIRCPIVPIGGIYQAVQSAMADEMARPGRDLAGVADQNFQARARAVVLMGLSNHLGSLVLTTGNKSELAVGYCTLYGDMSGGLAVIGDLPKMLVYDVSQSYNEGGVEVVPESTLTKPPSAELAPDQTDQDTLPPYPVLDAILEQHLIHRRDAEAIAGHGDLPLATVRRVVRMVEANEYKRRQAAPVLRVTRKAFGGGRRMPIARKLPAG